MEELLEKQYHVPIPLPQKDRPIGVSGLMRVKDEEEYVEASIESVITALDELIICYQKCSDRTPEILKRKQQEYPDKIKLYEYVPEIYAHNLTNEEWAYACSLPIDSIHLLSGYYNYTLSKASYRYAVKIDADQVYFTEKMQQLCDAFRLKKPVPMSWNDRLMLKSYRGVGYKGILKSIYRKLFLGGYELLYWQALLKRITHGNCLVWLSGIELYRKGDHYLMGVGDFGDGRYCSLYNGTEDHSFFEITEDTYYYPEKKFVYQNRQMNTYSYIEAFHLRKTDAQLYAGFLWFHMRRCKQKNIESLPPLQEFDYETFRKSSSMQLKKMGRFVVVSAYESYFSFFYDHFSKPGLDLLYRYLKKSSSDNESSPK